MKHKKYLLGFFAGVIATGVAWAATPSGGLHVFQAGDVILAEEVNENFSILEQRIDANCAAVKALAGLDPDEVNRVIQLLAEHVQKVEVNETKIEALEEKCVAAVSSITTLEETSVATVSSLSTLEECKDELVSITNSQNTRLDSLEIKTQFMSVNGTTTTFSGTNVQIDNGAGTTDTTNGLGNLFVGYNEDNGFLTFYGKAPIRTGSHNLVIGRDNQYTSHGGIVCGVLNQLNAPFGCVLSCENKVTGEFGTVVGGTLNNAKHQFSCVGGGSGQSTWRCRQWVAGTGGNGYGHLPARRFSTSGVTCPQNRGNDEEPQ